MFKMQRRTKPLESSQAKTLLNEPSDRPTAPQLKSPVAAPKTTSLMPLVAAIVLIISVSYPTKSFAWGKRGHALVCQTAAYLNATDAQTEFLKSSSFDLGYYCNAPDLVWKAPPTYKLEWFNHFMDMERFDRAFRSSAVKNPFELDRAAFDAAFPQVKESDGRAFWRIREFEQMIDASTQTLRGRELTEAQRQELQLKWITITGLMGHYVGDLSQPLHVTENYDGAATGQKGIHHFYEEVLVDELFSNDKGNIEADVERGARKQWPAFHKANQGKTTLQILMSLAEESNRLIPLVLKLDRKMGRKDIAKAALANRPTILLSLIRGSLAQAEIMSRHLGWNFSYAGHGDAFTPAPTFIPTPSSTRTHPSAAPGSTPTQPTSPPVTAPASPPVSTPVTSPSPAASTPTPHA